MKPSRLAFAVGIAGLALVAGCSPLPSYRYKITVEVETPEGLRTGSSVIEVRARREPKLLPDMAGFAIDVVGEAVAVDLPGGDTLFALLQGQEPDGYAESIARQMLTPSERSSVPYPETGEILSREKRGAVVSPGGYPLLVRFEDKAKPGTIQSADPANLSASFGPGVRLHRVTVQTTNAAVTSDIEQRLPWLGSYQGNMSVNAPSGVRHHLAAEHFKRPAGE